MIRDAVVGYERQVAASERGEKPLYRSRQWKYEERQQGKLLKKSAWFRPADSVVFVPATPGGELAGEMRKVVEEEGSRLKMHIKIIERGGTSLKNELTKPDLKADKLCGKPNCLMDMGDQPGCNHHKAGALYKAVCLLCEGQGVKAEYIGETGDSGYTRGLDHLGAVRNDQPGKSALAKHLREYHPGNLRDISAYRASVVRTFRSPLERQISEGVMIHNCGADILLNDKEEWIQPAVIRLQATQEPGGGTLQQRRPRGTQ